MRKKIWTILMMILLILLLGGCGNDDKGTDHESGTGKEGKSTENHKKNESVEILAEDREHDDIDIENLVASMYTYSDSYDSGIYYYAYNQYGEVMFSVFEQDRENDFCYINAFNLYKDDNSLDQYRYHMTDEWSSGLHLSLAHYNQEKEIEVNTSYRDVGFTESDTDGHKTYANGGYEIQYEKINDKTTRVFDKANDRLLFEEIRDEQNRLSLVNMTDSQGELYLDTKYEYDESGKYTTITYYNQDGSISRTVTEEVKLNDENQKEQSWTKQDGILIKENRYEYFSFYDENGYEHVKNYPLEGYWVGEKDGKKVFLVCSVNWWMCSGEIDPETGLYIIEYYIWAEPHEDSFVDGRVTEKGMFYCEWTENGVESGNSGKADKMPENVAYEVTENTLEFNGVTYKRVD